VPHSYELVVRDLSPKDGNGFEFRWGKKYDLILLGKGPSMKGCPFDIGVEVWAALSVLSIEGWEDKSYSKTFLFDVPDKKLDEQGGLKVAQARGIPIVSNLCLPFTTEPYPTREIGRMFGQAHFMNDMSYMIAMALYEGYKSLLLYGVDQGPGLIYQRGRPFTIYWLGVATGMGVSWDLAPDCILWRQSL